MGRPAYSYGTNSCDGNRFIVERRCGVVDIGGYVETIHGVNGILTEIRKGGYYGDVAFIATSDMRTFYCPVSDIKKKQALKGGAE